MGPVVSNCGIPRSISPGASWGASCTLLTMEPDRSSFTCECTCLAPLGEELGAEGTALFYLEKKRQSGREERVHVLKKKKKKKHPKKDSGRVNHLLPLANVIMLMCWWCQKATARLGHRCGSPSNSPWARAAEVCFPIGWDTLKPQQLRFILKLTDNNTPSLTENINFLTPT